MNKYRSSWQYSLDKAIIVIFSCVGIGLIIAYFVLQSN